MAVCIDFKPGCPPRLPLRGDITRASAARFVPYGRRRESPRQTHLYRCRRFHHAMEWPAWARLVAAINRIKKRENAVILAHNYMTPDIFSLVGDFRGDSLPAGREASATSADVIVPRRCALHGRNLENPSHQRRRFSSQTCGPAVRWPLSITGAERAL